MIKYASRLMEVIIAPLYLPGINDSEIPKLVSLAKELGCRMGIQNFLPYRYGQNPVKPAAMKDFYEMLAGMEKRHNVRLTLKPEEFGIEPARTLPKPFRKGDAVKVQIVCSGRHRGEMLGVVPGRCVTVTNCKKGSGTINARITRTKHNIFYARAL